MKRIRAQGRMSGTQSAPPAAGIRDAFGFAKPLVAR
jgi:hypothetical protein